MDLKMLKYCKECGGGGSAYCEEHGVYKYYCLKCVGSGICVHKNRKHRCSICSPTGHLAETVRKRIINALDGDKDKSSIEYLGCSIPFYMEYVEDMFEDWMDWSNHGSGVGTWQIDHIKPLMYNKPTIEEVIERLHYTNTQPLSWEENMKKGNRYIGK